MTLEEIASVGAVAGFASPIGLSGAEVVADELVMASPNLVAGANEEGWHLLDTNAGRDWEPDLVADIISADDGDACSVCGAPLRSERGVEVGNIFKLGTRFSEAFGATYLDPDGNAKPIVMGSYGIGVGRLLACIAEEHQDERGSVPALGRGALPGAPDRAARIGFAGGRGCRACLRLARRGRHRRAV